MPFLTGIITRHGAVIDVLVGVSRNRQTVLERNQLPVPSQVHVRAVIDTGSFVTGFTPAVFQQLGIGPIGVVAIRTSSTTPDQPHQCDMFDVRLALVTGIDQTVLPGVQVIASEDFDRDRDGDVHGIIGRDVLDHCVFTYFGLDQKFTLAF